MGEMAFLDLIIHNHDRLVKTEKRAMKKKIASHLNLGNMMLLDEMTSVLVPIDNAPNVFNPRFFEVIIENFYTHFNSDGDMLLTAQCIAAALDKKFRAKGLFLDLKRMTENIRRGLFNGRRKTREMVIFRMSLDMFAFSDHHRKRLDEFLKEVYNRIDFFRR